MKLSFDLIHAFDLIFILKDEFDEKSEEIKKSG
jgi:hypothetical protein